MVDRSIVFHRTIRQSAKVIIQSVLSVSGSSFTFLSWAESDGDCEQVIFLTNNAAGPHSKCVSHRGISCEMTINVSLAVYVKE